MSTTHSLLPCQVLTARHHRLALDGIEPFVWWWSGPEDIGADPGGMFEDVAQIVELGVEG